MAAYTAQQLADLRAAIATGALRVRTPSMETEFRSLEEMRQLERQISAEVEGAAVPPRASYARFSKD
jgi:hypothetical protein